MIFTDAETEALIAHIQNSDAKDDLKDCLVRMAKGEITVEQAVVELLRSRLKPLIDDAEKVDAEIERLFLGGTGP